MNRVVNKTVDLDLVGVDGNAHAIIGAFIRQAKRKEWSWEEIEMVVEEAQSKDYDHLLSTIQLYCEPG